MEQRLTPQARLQNQALTSRAERLRGKAEASRLESAREQFSATLLSFNADSGLWNCRLEDGSVIIARSIANSSSASIGSVVSLYKPAVGTAIVSWI